MEKSYKNQAIREIASEGIVMLKNQNGALPLKSTDRVAAFGRTFYYCFKGGAGSGDVLGVFPVHPYEAMLNTDITFDKGVSDFYNNFNSERYDPELKYWNRYDRKWVNSLLEAEIPDELIENAAKTCNKAIINIARSSGEWFDVPKEKGSFYLSDTEASLIERVTAKFESVILLLNTYGVVDTGFIKKYNFDSVVYTSMGGSEMGNAVADVLTGKESPSGKLTDTWADIELYPTHEGFQDLEIPYNEGIYVGYRYFDSFGVEVDFPFGFGLSYTDFRISPTFCRLNGSKVQVGASVENIGETAGKEVVQVYLSEPQGKLNKAYQQLAAFKKTRKLKAGEKEDMEIAFDLADFAAYDEEKAEFVLEKGDYIIRLGNSSRSTEVIAKIHIPEDIVTLKTVNRAVCPKKLNLIKADPKNFYTYGEEKNQLDNCPVLELSAKEVKCVTVKQPKENKPLESKGFFTLEDVRNNKATVEDLVAQFSDEQLVDIINGVTSQTFGTNLHVGTMAVTVEGAAGEIWSCDTYKIPPCINADGPTGIRLGGFIGRSAIPRDTELSLIMSAFPTATCVANTWNIALAQKMGECISDDMSIAGINGWLAPALNIHRNPLCGRNFEYYSEDPVISGEMAAGAVKGIQTLPDGSPSKHYATIKHFAANNAEVLRFDSDSLVSERALREIYLKGFEIAVKKSEPLALMNSYNKVNGVYASDSFDLNTAILRAEWGYEGCVMTDWSAKSTSAKMPHAGCDLVMPGCRNKDYLEGLKDGSISRADVQRCAVNVMRLVLKTTD